MRFAKKNSDAYMHLFAILNILGLTAGFIDIKLGIISSIIILILCLTCSDSKSYLLDIPFLVFIFANLLSGIAYMWNGRPLIVYFQAISFNVLPSLLYYAGRVAANSGKTNQLAEHLLNGFMFMMAIGTVTYLISPNFYYSYIGVSYDSYTYGIQEYRYGSYISSIALGSVGTMSVILYFFQFDTLARWKRATYLPLIILNVLLCMQRAAWILTFVGLAICMLIKLGTNRRARIKIIAAILFLIVAFYIMWIFRNKIFSDVQILYFTQRIGVLDFNSLISSRSDQWVNAWDLFISYPLTGFGLGACGQKAAQYNLAVVTDGCHLRILSEIGLVGFCAFAYMNLMAILKSLKTKNLYLALVVVICNLAAVGSPIFDQYYASFAYWLLLGCSMQHQQKRIDTL